MLEEAIARYAKPEILNTDQGSQYSGAGWIPTLTKTEIKISMDGRGRHFDNIFIERLGDPWSSKPLYSKRGSWRMTHILVEGQRSLRPSTRMFIDTAHGSAKNLGWLVEHGIYSSAWSNQIARMELGLGRLGGSWGANEDSSSPQPPQTSQDFSCATASELSLISKAHAPCSTLDFLRKQHHVFQQKWRILDVRCKRIISGIQ